MQDVQTTEYWETLGSPLIDFQYFSDFFDWTATLRAICEQIHTHTNRAADRVSTFQMLDYGCGFAHSLRDTISILNFYHDLPTKWIGYDPDRDLIKLLSRKTISSLQQRDEIPGIYRFIDSLEEIGEMRFDCILLMHSIYYVPDVIDLLTQLTRNLLTDDGCIIILRLAKTSPFYVLPEFVPSNRTYELENRFDIEFTPRRMRFKIPDRLLQNESFMAELFHALSRGRASVGAYHEFLTKARDEFRGTVDLQDEIGILTQRSTLWTP
jgi:SAM-dependent methyltransferase